MSRYRAAEACLDRLPYQIMGTVTMNNETLRHVMTMNMPRKPMPSIQGSSPKGIIIDSELRQNVTDTSALLMIWAECLVSCRVEKKR